LDWRKRLEEAIGEVTGEVEEISRNWAAVAELFGSFFENAG
jgi:hypothetical protein